MAGKGKTTGLKVVPDKDDAMKIKLRSGSGLHFLESAGGIHRIGPDKSGFKARNVRGRGSKMKVGENKD